MSIRARREGLACAVLATAMALACSGSSGDGPPVLGRVAGPMRRPHEFRVPVCHQLCLPRPLGVGTGVHIARLGA